MNTQTQILSYINENTDREMLEEKSTKEVAQEFNISTKDAYSKLNDLFQNNLIMKLGAVNGNNFECCGWVRLED